MGELHELTAAELSGLYQTKEARPTEVLAACLSRYEVANPELNAIVSLDRAGADKAARASDARWSEGRPLSSLDGIVVTIKDNLKMGGLAATWGSRAYVSHIPERDEASVARLREAGAILLGKTNTPELALAGYTSNSVFGSTGNPWDPALTPGGSSGGAVASVMSGMAQLALATDAGGSIRRPAGHVGACGLRTTPGLVPRRGGFPALANDLQTTGPIARSVEDLALMLECLSPAGRVVLDQPLLGRARIGLVGAIEGHPVEPEILDRLELTAGLLERLGAKVEEVACPFDPIEAGELFMTLASVGVAATLETPMMHGFEPTAAILRLVEAGRLVDGVAYARTLAHIAEIRRQMADWFTSHDFLLTPSAAAFPWPRDEAFPAKIAGVAASPRASAIYTGFVNVAGLPALAFPVAPSQAGLPIGMQLVGPAGSDLRLLAAGRAIEAEAPWPRVARRRRPH